VDLTFLTGFLGGVVGAASKEAVSWIFKEAARRQSELDAVEQIVLSTFSEVRTLAIAHWSENETAPAAAARKSSIVARIQFCAKLYPELFKGSLEEKRRMDVVFVQFRKALTGDKFGQLDRGAMPGRADDIEVATYGAMHQIKMGRIRSRQLRLFPWRDQN
jgi:hypothetical protein